MSDNGLKLAQQSLLISVISTFAEVDKIILFGSRAINTFKDRSDIDLVLVGPKLTIEQQSQMLSTIEQTTIPYSVDLLLYHQIKNDDLLQHIKEHGVVWFEK